MALTPLKINCDLGEWTADHLQNIDPELMPYLDMANVACGGHAGNSHSIEQTIRIAQEYDVQVGAHPGYEDKQNFGRVYVPLSQSEITDLLDQQISLFRNACAKLSVSIHHIKPHGALYHAVNHRELESDAMIYYLQEMEDKIPILLLPGSLLSRKMITANLPFLNESFIDRTYQSKNQLTPRTQDNAVIKNIEVAKKQFENLSLQKVRLENGSWTDIQSETACIHGDNPSALEILKSIRE